MEDGDSIFLRKVGTYLQIHKAPKPKTSKTTTRINKLSPRETFFSGGRGLLV
jgi:hypothetical protein